MVEVFMDINVLIDYLAAREKFYDSAKKLFKLAEQKDIVMNIASVSYGHVYYLMYQYVKKTRQDEVDTHKLAIEARNAASNAVDLLLQITKCLPIDLNVIKQAHNSDFLDFEDAIQFYCALQNPECKVIITRDENDYKNSTIPVMNPDEFLELFYCK